VAVFMSSILGQGLVVLVNADLHCIRSTL